MAFVHANEEGRYGSVVDALTLELRHRFQMSDGWFDGTRFKIAAQIEASNCRKVRPSTCIGSEWRHI
jgi:hypothetical protein